MRHLCSLLLSPLLCFSTLSQKSPSRPPRTVVGPGRNSLVEGSRRREGRTVRLVFVFFEIGGKKERKREGGKHEAAEGKHLSYVQHPHDRKVRKEMHDQPYCTPATRGGRVQRSLGAGVWDKEARRKITLLLL